MITLLLLGCKNPEPSPSELTELCAWTFAHQDDADALPDGLSHLDAWLDQHAGEQEGWQLPPLSDDDVAEVDHADRDVAAALGAVVEGPSAHDLDAHVAFILLPDQSVVNPDDYDLFARSFLEGGDCFAPGDCAMVRTWNDVIKNASFGVQIPYAYQKDYHRVDYVTEAGDARTAVVSRGSVPEESFAEDGKNGILQSYTLDVFLSRPEGIHRVQAQWSEMELLVELPEDFLVNELIDGLGGVFEDTDAAIDALDL